MPDSLNGLTRTDWIRVGSAVIFFIASFLPFVGVSASSGAFHISVSINAWHGFALLGLLIAFAAMILWALMRFASITLPTVRFPWELIIPAAAALGVVLVALRGTPTRAPA
jgi:drug/metabolite transporter (DMT)-like permease